MMKFFFSLILLIICQYLFNPMTVDARPARVKKFSWAFPIHNEHDDHIIRQPFVKRRGPGWGKRNAIFVDEHPDTIDEHSSARIWFDDK